MTAALSKWRRRLWPVYSSELKIFLPLLLIKFCVSFNFSVLHTTKDTLIITAQGSGAEVIPVLKGGAVLLFAFLFMLGYAKLSNHLSYRRLFYIVLAPFLCFFALYGLVLYPYRDLLIPTASADWLVSLFGESRSHLVVVYRYWMDSLFFLMAELWGGVVIGLLFWGFANRLNTVQTASRFYSLLSAGGHIGVVCAGPIIWYYTQNEVPFASTVEHLMLIVSGLCLLIMGVFWWVNRQMPLTGQVEKLKESVAKLSLKESLKHIVRSPYLRNIALMVIGYSLSVNMIEVIWKGTLKIRYPTPSEYQSFTGLLYSITGVISFFLAWCVGGNMIRKFGWKSAALSTPIVLGLTSAAFLTLYLVAGPIDRNVALTAPGILLALVILGAIHNVSCKSMKYCLFDPTKEIAYIPLDEEEKTKGKAAVDVVASRFGKSGSSWVQVGLMEVSGTGSILSIVPYVTPFVIAALLFWMTAVYFIGGKVVAPGRRVPETA